MNHATTTLTLTAYDMEAEALRVSKLGYVATHRGAFFLSTTLAHELVEIDCYGRIRARVLFGTMNLGDIVAKPKRRQLRFSPVESVDLSQHNNTASEATVETVTHVSR